MGVSRVWLLISFTVVGISPLVNPQSTLYSQEVFRTKHLHFDLSSPASTDPSGEPFAFVPKPLPGLPLGYFVWFDMGLPLPVTQHRLEYLKDSGFFSGRRADRAQMQFLGIDAARQTLVFTRLTIEWKKGGSIRADVTITGMPMAKTADTFWVSNLLSNCLHKIWPRDWL